MKEVKEEVKQLELVDAPLPRGPHHCLQGLLPVNQSRGILEDPPLANKASQ